MKMRNLIAMLLCLTCIGCSSVVDDDEVVERVRVGDRVPAFTVNVLTPADGGAIRSTFSTSELRGETVIVLFHTSCPDCQRELPRLNEYYMQHIQDEDFQMVAISREEDEQSVADFWAAKGLQIPFSAQTDRSIYDLFASSIIPRVYFVSAQGIVTRVFVEQLPETF